MRNLVSIQEVKEVKDLENSDFLAEVTILGWKVIVNKKEGYKKGEKVVYFEVDSFLPVDERYEFLRASSYRNNEVLGEGFRLRTVKLRGSLSQGLILPLAIFKEFSGRDLEIGEDVTEILGVIKWDVALLEGSQLGEVLNDTKPYFIPTTDETRVQSIPDILDVLKGKAYYITTKCDGTSVTIVHKDGKVHICGRKDELVKNTKSWVYNYLVAQGLEEKLLTYGRNIALQGELCGPKIQKNLLGLSKQDVYFFNVYDLDTDKYLAYDEMMQVLRDLEVLVVPIEEEGASFEYTLDDLLIKAQGEYSSGKRKEGIVVRSSNYEKNVGKKEIISFKVLNNNYLLKEK